MDDTLRNFLKISYDELEERNLEAKEKRTNREKRDDEKLEAEYRKYLIGEKRIKAVTVCFSDIEGRFHMLDYDKKFLLDSADNLTFDGSSIRGFTVVSESDLRLKLDWGSFYWLPSDLFGAGKVVIFADIYDTEGNIHSSDFRARLRKYADEAYKKDKSIFYAANEIEGFLIDGIDAETDYNESKGFKLVTAGGYYYSSPMDPLKMFIDSTAEAQRALGFGNEKDHPEVAPSQFELNYSYSDVVNAADQIQLYKLVARQVAKNMGMTASFLPKPATGINGNGMHTNISISRKGKNVFFDKSDKNKMSKEAYKFIYNVLGAANGISLVLNSSVNSYRRLDPHFEAPNQIKFSPIDRTSMVRLPLGNEKSARVEVRSVGPDANPYMLFYTLFRVGLEQKFSSPSGRVKTLPSNIYDAITEFRRSKVTDQIIGAEVKSKFIDVKKAAADRSPKDLGTIVKRSEVVYHHEITNQYLWNKF